MATDATGTPTTNFSIPKFLTSADPPSGKGENSIADFLDALLKKGFVQFTATGDLVFASAPSVAARLPIGSTGQVLTIAGGVPVWGAAGGPGAPALTLPGSPTDGQQAILTDSIAAPTYNWLLQWSAAASKWLFIGGSPANAQVDTAESLNSVAYVDVATAGPSFTTPRGGSYLLSYGALIQWNTGTDGSMWVSPKIGAGATSDTDGAVGVAAGVNATQNGAQVSVSRTKLFTGIASSNLLKLQYREGTASALNVANRFLTVTPIALT